MYTAHIFPIKDVIHVYPSGDLNGHMSVGISGVVIDLGL